MLSPKVLLACLPLALAADIYVAPKAASGGSGTLASPLNSIQAAIDKAKAGDTIYLRNGTYAVTSNLQVTKSGTSSARITLTAYGNELVVIDGEGLPNTPAPVGGSIANKDRGILHVEGASYWRFYRLTFVNGPYGVYMRDSSNNVFESITTHDNYETGFQMQGSLTNNQVINLDSYMNRDPRKNGESADGFACKEGSGEGNLLKGARLWNNVDDGLDLWEFKSRLTIQDTISWGNGVNRWNFKDFQGDGNGFKLGGGDASDKGPANHVVTNCIAFNNAATGFTDNSQPGTFTLTRNTAWNNGGVGFNMKTPTATLTGNVAANNNRSNKPKSQINFSSSQKSSGNSWDAGTGVWDDSVFQSVDVKLVQGARGSNGKIASSNFLLLKSGQAIGATTAWS